MCVEKTENWKNRKQKKEGNPSPNRGKDNVARKRRKIKGAKKKAGTQAAGAGGREKQGAHRRATGSQRQGAKKCSVTFIGLPVTMGADVLVLSESSE